jgi:5-methylcytosine-specific restriction endonuclease McrA
MRNIGREGRYLTTKRKDGLFEVYDTSDYRSRKLILKLDLCKNCVDELNDRGLWLSPFSLEKYFEKYDSQVPKTIRRIETVTEVQNYTPNQDDISREYRKAANFICQKCGVNCSSEPSLLHLHHRDGDRSNNDHLNLYVLCIECHSREPMHEHLLFPQSAKDQVEKIKSLRQSEGIIELGVPL